MFALGRTVCVAALAVLPGVLCAQSDDDLRRQVAELTTLVKKLQARVDQLEAKLPDAAPPPPVTAVQAAPAAAAVAASPSSDPWRGTTVNFLLDGYYGYNFNSPIGRVNLLRAYDVSSNSFSLNQAGVVIEHAPDPANGNRFGARLDLQWGQATQTLQGNPANEPRPEIYRAIFQAYGTYVAPVGHGLTVDFGKWSSAIGLEGNYTKDQINYSRSLWFDYLPFYHMGARVNYKVNDVLAVNYWITNGAQQAEAFKGFKDQLAGFVLTPNKNISWTFNYYLGQEHPDVQYYLNGGAPAGAPTIQGVPFEPIIPAPTGRLHIFDTYATWQAAPKLLLAAEGDWTIERLYTDSAPAHTAGGALYARYQLTPKFAVAGRAEYLSDRGGIFSGATQALKEITFTTDYQIAEGFLMRTEWRRDASNHPYFYTDLPGIRKKEQNTATLGLVWWFGGKRGTW